MAGRHKLTRRAALALALIVLSGACSVPTQLNVSGQTESLQALKQDEAVVLFPARRNQGYMEQDGFYQCLDAKFGQQASASLKVMDAAAFQDAMFPWFEADRLPQTARDLDALITRPVVRQRIAALKVRYLVTIAAVTESDGFPGILCGGGYGGAGCLGLMTQERTTRMSAVIWDIKLGELVGSVSAKSSGESFGLAFVVPLLFLARTEQDACEALADELKARLIAGSS